jgi:Holin of 3TMs, for gene-transfer release
MDWKDLAAVVGKTAPLLGTLIGGPAGAAIGGIVASVLGCANTPDAVSQAIAVNPDAAVKLAQIESDERVRLQQLALAHADNQIQADTAQLQAVNATMQVETKGEHWPTYTWRPFNGFIVGVMAFGCYFVLPLCKLPVPAIPESVWLMFGAILGVASWFRGQAQVAGTTSQKG